MKKFIVTGTPRSGTTFLCKQIASLDNVVMYEDWDYEPFGGYGGVLDESEYLRQLESDHPDKIVGLKAFWQDSFLMDNHIRKFHPIVLIRKDIQKVYLSLIVLMRKGYDETKSSRRRPGVESIEYSDFGLSYMANTLLKTYYYSEKMPKFFKLYFEDLLPGNTTLDTYFENKINLDTGYIESELTDYHPDPERFLSILKRTALGMDHKKLPEYVRENLDI
tara:strand:- start:248 stop:907 length:660 start_codon:yes stop_codon:yes gene_type:complete